MTPPSNSAAPRAPLHFLGLACAIGVSTIYFNQPLLVEMGKTYSAPASHVMVVASATQVGYALGLLLFVPLGDLLERRALMKRMFAAVIVALLLVTMAPTLAWLIAVSVLLGLMASVTHIVLPIAPELVPHKQRGRAIGTVMMGLLLGVLLARTFSGWVSHIPALFVYAPRLFPQGAFWVTDGWRYVFFIAAVGNAVFLLFLGRMMPPLPPSQDMRYADAMRSLWTLVRTQPLLRESSLISALVFAAFSCFWTTLAYMLSSHYGLGAGVAGSFGLVGAAGASVAPIAGKLADKHGTRWVLTTAIALLAISYLVLWAGVAFSLPLTLHIAALVIGVIVLDVGMQMTQIANQTRIFGLDASARSRLNTVYMTSFFAGGAVGSALATMVWDRWHWNGVCILALALIALTALCHALGTRTREPFNPDSRTDHPVLDRVIET